MDVSDLSSSWNPISSHFDTHKEHGLSFPHMNASTQWTCRQQTEGLLVDQVTIVDVVPKGIQSKIND